MVDPRLYVKSGWMPPAVRFALLACRPWSVPASLVPTALTAGLVYDRVPSIAHIILPIVGALCLHMFGNLINTWWDFHKGLDKVSNADDRTLVDRTVSSKAVILLALVFLALGTAAGVGVVLPVGLPLLAVSGAGVALAFFYTADPLSLKYLGLGDVCIFLAFGPLLMGGMAMAATVSASPDPLVLLMSVPTGLLTAAIVHANNTRDVAADRAAGARTLAMFLGFQRSFVLYVGELLAAYVISPVVILLAVSRQYDVPAAEILSAIAQGVASLSIDDITHVRLPVSSSMSVAPSALAAAFHVLRATLILGLLTFPWAISLVGRFSRRDLAELPQATAQFDLLFGACVIAGLLPLELLARVCLASLFYLGGFNNIIMWSHVRLLVRQKLTAISPWSVPSAVADFLAASASGIQLIASLTLALGIAPRLSAVALIALILPYSSIVHDFWNTPDTPIVAQHCSHAAFQHERRDAASQIAASPLPRRRGRSAATTTTAACAPSTAAASASPTDGLPSDVPTFLTLFDNEFVHFFKNVLALGGLLCYLALPGNDSDTMTPGVSAH